MDQCLMGSDKRFCYRGCFDIADLIWNGKRHAFVDAGVLGISTTSHNAHDPVAKLEMSNALAKCDHFASDFETQQWGVSKLCVFAVAALALVDVSAVNPGSSNAHQQVVVSHLRQWQLDQPHNRRLSEVFKSDSLHRHVEQEI
jgi:hypothetical protein